MHDSTSFRKYRLVSWRSFYFRRKDHLPKMWQRRSFQKRRQRLHGSELSKPMDREAEIIFRMALLRSLDQASNDFCFVGKYVNSQDDNLVSLNCYSNELRNNIITTLQPQLQLSRINFCRSFINAKSQLIEVSCELIWVFLLFTFTEKVKNAHFSIKLRF